MTPVEQDDVVTHWLETETGERYEDLKRGERLSKLLHRNPDAALAFVNHDHEWYRTKIAPETIGNLYTAWGDDGIDETISVLARRIHNGERPLSDVSSETSTQGRELAEKYPDGQEGRLVISFGTWRRPFIADGNHRAVGLALAAQMEASPNHGRRSLALQYRLR